MSCAPTDLAPSMVDALHLASASLPVGGFAYSQGLEQAHANGLLSCREDAARWIRDVLLLVLARQELVLWVACHSATTKGRYAELERHVSRLCALRETAEFRLESRQMGFSMVQMYPQWIDDQQMPSGEILDRLALNYTAAHAALTALRGLPCTVGLAAYVWSWLESQVMASIKIIPLGQRDGQWLLHQARPWLDKALDLATRTSLAEAGSAAFGLSIASAWHETQYCRLFRS